MWYEAPVERLKNKIQFDLTDRFSGQQSMAASGKGGSIAWERLIMNSKRLIREGTIYLHVNALKKLNASVGCKKEDMMVATISTKEDEGVS